MLNLHIYPSPIVNESRILRETRSAYATGLFSGIEVAGAWRRGLPKRQPWHDGVTIRRFGREAQRPSLLAKTAKTLGLAAEVFQFYRRRDIGVINCHSAASLPLSRALASATGAKLIYDTHELESETSGLRGIRKSLVKVTEASLIGSVDHTFVVGKEIEKWYTRRYGPMSIDTLYNYPSVLDDCLRQPDCYFQHTFRLPLDTTIFLYLGVLAKGRGIEAAIEVFDQCRDRPWALVIMGYGALEPEVRGLSSLRPNVFFHPAVGPEEVLSMVRQADVGLSLIEKSAGLSFTFAAPNKLFQYLFAGAIAVVSDIPEQRAVVGDGARGVIAASLGTADVLEAFELAATLSHGELGGGSDFAWESYQDLIEARYRRLVDEWSG